jgi:hypothetical protein
VAVSRILELNVVGGFLDGMTLQFDGGLNCIIGSRGARIDPNRRALQRHQDALGRIVSRLPSHHIWKSERYPFSNSASLRNCRCSVRKYHEGDGTVLL